MSCAQALELAYKSATAEEVAANFDGIEVNVMIYRRISVTTFPNGERQAQRQSEALTQNRLTARWEVPNQTKANRSLKIFDELGIDNIEVKVVPE